MIRKSNNHNFTSGVVKIKYYQQQNIGFTRFLVINNNLCNKPYFNRKRVLCKKRLF